MRHVAPILCLALSCLAAACSSPASGGTTDMAVEADGHPALSRQMAFTHTHEITFGVSDQVTGYLVEFLNVPDGVEDRRDFPPGTVLLQDLEFRTVGLITPGQEGLAFSQDGSPTSLGRGGREQLVMAIFGRSERPVFHSILPGVPGPRR